VQWNGRGLQPLRDCLPRAGSSAPTTSLSAITYQTEGKSDILPHYFWKIEEEGVRKCMVLAIGGLLLLAGCQKSDKSAGIPVEPKWKGEPYRIAFDARPVKPSPTGLNIPAVKFTANPDALETRAILVLRFTAAQGGNQEPAEHLMVGEPVDIHGPEGTLPDDYMDRARKGLSDYLDQYCLKGKVNLSVALARSSLNPQSAESQVDVKRLSDWLPFEIVYKNPHSKCK
jgi:hypothetical protein